MIDLTINPKIRESNAAYCRDRGISLPTFKMMREPQQVPANIQQQLKKAQLWEITPANLFRVTWKNEPVEQGGLFGEVNHLLLPPQLSGCAANIIVLSGRWFPTGAHKVGAAYSCLAPRLITGQFNPQTSKAVWPSTGNYCRGGAYISALLACRAVAILPEGMSRERFDWLKKVAGEVIATYGTESNVKEIFDKCAELRAGGDDLLIFNQFDELGNPLWHYNVTGPAAEELLYKYMNKNGRFAAYVASSGSGGTLGGGYYLKKKHPHSKLVVAEALQCPTLLNNGFGEHRIEGIGDKHVPWVHDCKETDAVVAVDDEKPMRLLRLFNDPVGKKLLSEEKVDPEVIEKLNLLGISGISNVLAAIKYAKYRELTSNDYLLTIATDSMDLYGSRLQELNTERGAYDNRQANRDWELLQSISYDNMAELSYRDKKRTHNLKYYTWIEQQGRDVKELNAQWYDHEYYWNFLSEQVEQVDNLIEEFNQMIAK